MDAFQNQEEAQTTTSSEKSLQAANCVTENVQIYLDLNSIISFHCELWPPFPPPLPPLSRTSLWNHRISFSRWLVVHFGARGAILSSTSKTEISVVLHFGGREGAGVGRVEGWGGHRVHVCALSHDPNPPHKASSSAYGSEEGRGGGRRPGRWRLHIVPWGQIKAAQAHLSAPPPTLCLNLCALPWKNK